MGKGLAKWALAKDPTSFAEKLSSVAKKATDKAFTSGKNEDHRLAAIGHITAANAHEDHIEEAEKKGAIAGGMHYKASEDHLESARQHIMSIGDRGNEALKAGLKGMLEKAMARGTDDDRPRDDHGRFAPK